MTRRTADILGGMILCAYGVALSGYPAMAQDPTGQYANSPYREWFDAQLNANGNSCCLSADAHAYSGDYTLNADGSVDIDVNGKPLHIEAYKVINTPEPPGMNMTIIWFSGAEPVPGTTYCFHPGPLT